jgi:type ISP restriction-modification system protein
LLRQTGVGAGTLFAYLAVVLAHPGFTVRFAADLVQPGLRVPLTAEADLFAEAVDLGRQVTHLRMRLEEIATAGLARGRKNGLTVSIWLELSGGTRDPFVLG